MVVQDGFEVVLYDPFTEKPHKEFTKGGNTFVEAYPDGEYYIQVQWLDRSATGNANLIEAHFFVDQKGLDYYRCLRIGNILQSGLRNNVDGSYRALAFTLPKLNFVAPTQGPTTSAVSPSSMFGEVTVCIHERIITTQRLRDMKCPVEESIVASSLDRASSVALFHSEDKADKASLDVCQDEKNATGGKKVFRSKPGTNVLAPTKPKNNPKKAVVASNAVEKPKSIPKKVVFFSNVVKKKKFVKKPKRARGRHLATITLKYCSTVGLIAAGVLENPNPDRKRHSTSNSAATQVSQSAQLQNLNAITETITYTDDHGLSHQAIQIDLTKDPEATENAPTEV